MSFTTFLMIFLLIVMVFIAFNKIMNSSAFRIALITHQEKLRQKEIEKEIQKTKQRSIEEIRNPDLLMEVIEKMSRGEEIKIPLAAFDYIYRNMRKFTIIDKQGKLTIINQEDYLQFKKIAENLLRISDESQIDVKKIMDSIKKQEKENPIEFQTHEDGTIVEINHLKRKFIIQKKNGEKHIVDYINNTIVSENLVEQDEKKITPSKYFEAKDALTEAEKKLKKVQQELLLEKNKNAKNKSKK